MDLRPLVALFVLVAGVAPVAGAGAADESAAPSAQPRADPPSDRVGWEDGYWHDDPIDVNQSDGLTDREMDALVARSMARVEYIREAEFTQSVDVAVISRAAYRERQGNATANESFAAWNNQVWEALFVDGEDTNVQNELSGTLSSSVAGFYAPSSGEIRIVTTTPDSPTIDNGTLVHELTHALQDQQGRLTSARPTNATQDASLAANGLIEGEANYIEQRYAQRCGAEWSCAAPPASGGASGGDPNFGILLTILQPYSDGPVYVNSIREREGWDAVSEAFDSPPVSTEQTIHLTDEKPVPIEYTDRATDGWRRYPNQGQNGSDTVGEASIYAMFWYQARQAGADTVNPRAIAQTDSPFDTYNYSAEPSAGWGNDRVFPYRNPGRAEGGYVWVTEWDTPEDAREFRRAYEAILRAHDAERQNGTWVVPEGQYADAFRVTRDGTRVTIVNGPDPAAVAAIRPATGADDDGGSVEPAFDRNPTLALGAIGVFGVVGLVAVVALVGAVLRRD
ncbi:MAG: Hvo_1808 family surface protein [Haloferacaceae archaeon]